MAERQHTDWDGLGADWLVGCLTGRLGYDTAGAAADSPRFLLLPPLLSLDQGLPVSPTSMCALKEAPAHGSL